MPRAIGANCRLLMLPETTYGTAPGSNWRRMPFLSCDLGAEQPLLDADVIGVGSNRDPAAPFLDTVTVAGQAVVPVDLINIGHWLRLLLGAPATTGSTNFIHTFGSGAASLPSNAMEIGYPDVPSFDVCTGVRADTLEMDFTPTGAATATFGLLGQGSVRTGATSGGTPTSAAYTAFNKAQGSITRSGSALAQVTGARLTYANGMEAVRTIRADRRVEGVDHRPRKPSPPPQPRAGLDAVRCRRGNDAGGVAEGVRQEAPHGAGAGCQVARVRALGQRHAIKVDCHPPPRNLAQRRRLARLGVGVQQAPHPLHFRARHRLAAQDAKPRRRQHLAQHVQQRGEVRHRPRVQRDGPRVTVGLARPVTGSRSHGVPVTSTNRMPVSAARSGRRGRPPFGFGRSGGSSGATAAQRSSETRGFAMPAPTRQSRFR